MIWTILASLILAGSFLILLSLRGRRIDEHPICRRCRFDLVGLFGREPRCPECGGDLSRPRAVRVGNRQRRRRLGAAGVMLLLAALLPAGLIAGGAAGVNWNTHKPGWWLAADARSSDDQTASAAMEELTARLRDGRIDRDRAMEIIELALARQADRSAGWSEAWGAYLDMAQRAEMFSPEQLERYIRGAVNITIEPSGIPAQGTPWLMEMRLDTRMTMRSGDMISVWTNLVDVNGAPVDDPSENVVAVSARWGSAVVALSRGHPALLDLPPGNHTATLRARIAIGDGPTRPEETRLNREENFVVMATVAATGEPAAYSHIELAPDESLREQMKQAIQIRNLRVEDAGGAAGHSGTGALLVRQPPADGAFEIYWRYADPDAPGSLREARVGQFSFKKGTRSGGMSGHRLTDEFVRDLPSQVDVVLRPSAEVAATKADLTRIWDGEIVFRDVAVRHHTEGEDPEQ